MARLIIVLWAACLLLAFEAAAGLAAPRLPGGAGRGLATLDYLPGLTPEEARKVEVVADEALAEMRGRYAGYYFSTDLSGYWDSLGNQNARLQTLANISEQDVPPPEGPSTDLSDPNIPDVRIHAFVGSLANTSGLIQITQVPGNNNVITTVMNLKIMIINVNDAAADLSHFLPQIAGF